MAGCPSGRCQYCCGQGGAVRGGTTSAPTPQVPGGARRWGPKAGACSYLPKNDLEVVRCAGGQVRLVCHQRDVVALQIQGGSGRFCCRTPSPTPPRLSPPYRDLDVGIRQGGPSAPWGVAEGVAELPAVGAHLRVGKGVVGMGGPRCTCGDPPGFCPAGS